MTTTSIEEAFAAQAGHCENLGSPFTARLCRLLAGRVGMLEGAVAERLRGWSGNPGHRGDAVPLRLAGGLHALVLSGADSELAAVYPPHHEAADDAALWAAVARALVAHDGFLLDWLDSSPQTNEVRRSGPLYLGLATLAAETGMPIALNEIGASAGLNLLLEHYAYDFGRTRMGPSSAPLRISADWSGPAPKLSPPRILDRTGCDRRPLDVDDETDQLRVLAYLWADQADRIKRTKRAITLAEKTGLRVEQAEAADFVARRFTRPAEGMVHVLMHSIVWQYLDGTSQKRIRAAMARAGAAARPERPLAWLAMEGDGKHPGAALTLTLWPGCRRRLLARCDFHGRWIAAS